MNTWPRNSLDFEYKKHYITKLTTQEKHATDNMHTKVLQLCADGYSSKVNDALWG